jgi:hypothetical protein
MRLSKGITLALIALAVSVGVISAAPLSGLLLIPVIGMAAETTTTALIDQALKVIFATSIHDDIVADSELMGLFQTEMNIKSEETTGGRYIEQGHFWTLPAGAGWRMDDEYIPEAVSATFKNSRIYLKKFHITLQMSGDTMRRVRTDEGAFLDYMERARPAIVERANQELDLAYIGYGSGIKARANAAAVSTGTLTFTLVVKDHSGIAGFTDAWLTFLEGERVIFAAEAAATTIRNAGATRSAKVTDIDEGLNKITFTADDATAKTAFVAQIVAGDFIFTGDAAGHSGPDAAGTARALSGLLAGADDGLILANYNNIDRTAVGNRLWKSIVVNGAAAPFNGALTEDLLNFAFRQAHLRGSGKPDFLVMSYSARDSYWKAMKGDRFFIDPGGNYKGGRGRLEIVLGDTAYPFRVARKLPPEVCFGIQKDRWARLTLGQLTWEEETGSMWNRVVDTTGRKDSYYSVAHLYEQLYNAAPRKSFRIDGIAPVS